MAAVSGQDAALFYALYCRLDHLGGLVEQSGHTLPPGPKEEPGTQTTPVFSSARIQRKRVVSLREAGPANMVAGETSMAPADGTKPAAINIRVFHGRRPG